MSGHGPKWGAGAVTSARRRRLPPEPTPRCDGGDGGAAPANDNGSFDSSENPFESIGRALDRQEEDARRTELEEANAEAERLESMSLDHPGELDEGADADAGEEQLEIPTDVRGPPNDDDIGNQGSFDAEEELEEPTADATVDWRLPNGKTPSQHKAASGVPRTSANGTTSNGKDGASKNVGESALAKKSTTPPRFTFHSQSTAKPKRSATANPTLKTPSNRQLPPRALFPSSTFSTRTSNTTAKKVSGQSTAKRKHRHSFRPSSGGASATPAAKSNVREMKFAPDFLPGTKGSHSPKDGMAEDDGEMADSGANGGADGGLRGDAFSRNLILGHQQRQRAERRSEGGAGAGRLVQRLRSLKNDEQRMAMRLRSGQSSATHGSGGVGGSALLRKRRRGGDADPKNAASSTLDVTVSGISVSDDKASALLGEGRALLLAYVHQHTVTKPPSAQRGDAMQYPCYAYVLMSHDAMREQGISDCSTKQLRFFDAVVIPPRVESMDQSADSSKAGKEKAPMPTIVCTHVCQAVEEPLAEVSFDA